MIEYAQGVVVDNNDPEGKARVKVRIDKYHTLLNETTNDYGLTDEDLDWYPVLMPTTSSSRGGRGYSPSGLMVNDRVSLLILDTEYIQSALVIGTIHGDGDVSNIAIGGIEGIKSESVQDTNNNLAEAPKLDEREWDEEGGLEEDDVGYDIFFRTLIDEEGFRDKPYYDSFNRLHIGIGTLLHPQAGYPMSKAWGLVEKKFGKKYPSKRLPKEDAIRVAKQDIKKIEGELQKYPQLALAYNKVSQTRKYGLMHMMYQMGVGGVAKFKNSLNLIIQEDWNGAYRNLLKSKWATQTPARAKRVASIIRDNNFNAYPYGRGKTRSGNSLNLREKQLELMNSTESVRGINDVKSYEDVESVYTAFSEYDTVLTGYGRMMEGVDSEVKTASDLESLTFTQKYIARVKEIIRKIFEMVKSFVVRIGSEASEALENLVKLISLIVDRIFFNTDKVDKKVNESLTKAQENLHEEYEEPEENGLLFAEPPSEYAGEYPHVKTEISESGHVFEVDDTPGFERIKERHRSGTFREISPNGRIVEKTVSDRYLIVSNNDHIYIQGTGKITIGGNHEINIIGDCKQIINGDLTQTVRGNVDVEVDGNNDVLIKGNSNLHIEGDSDVHVEGNSNVHIEGDSKLHIEGNSEAHIEGNFSGEIEGDSNLSIKGNATTDIEGDFRGAVHGETELYAHANVTSMVAGHTSLDVQGTTYINSDGDIELRTSSNLDVKASGNINFKANGAVGIYGSKIYLDKS